MKSKMQKEVNLMLAYMEFDGGEPLLVKILLEVKDLVDRKEVLIETIDKTRNLPPTPDNMNTIAESLFEIETLANKARALLKKSYEYEDFEEKLQKLMAL
jgi:hypothetical protein